MKKIYILFTIHIIFIILLTILEEKFGINYTESKVSEMAQNPKELFFFAVIFAPIIEEFLFRYTLKRSKYYNVIILVNVFLFYLISQNYVFSIIYIILNLITSIYFNNIRRHSWPLYLIILNILLFTVIHTLNVDFNLLIDKSKLKTIFQFLPQLLLGIILSFIRLKQNFKIAIAYHCAYNLIFVLLSFTEN